MALFTYLYEILIGPIELLIEVIYACFYTLFRHYGWSIVGLSFAVNTLTIPMYHKAVFLEDKERVTRRAFEKPMRHIRETFSGNERFVMVSTLYRQNKYKPFYALRGSMSLLLQVPFFIAAYHYLSELTVLDDIGFFGIQRLSLPDRLLKIGGMEFNILPLMMTVINVISGMIYLKDSGFREKAQMYGMALFFLLLLYNSPSGLVLYWTCNNLFSLGRNIAGSILHFTSADYKIITGTVVLFFLLIHIGSFLGLSIKIKAIFILCVFFGFFLLASGIYSKKTKKSIMNILVKRYNGSEVISSHPSRQLLFFGFFMTLVTGLLIPSAVICASPTEFVLYGVSFDPVTLYLPHSICLAAGTFLLWMQIYVYFCGMKICNLIVDLIPYAMVVVIVNYFFFGLNYGVISPDLVYDHLMIPSVWSNLLNIVVIISVCVVVFFIKLKWNVLSKYLAYIMMVSIIAVFIMSINQIITIKRLLGESKIELMMKEGESESNASNVIVLSKDEKNVVVICLDRAIGLFVPYIMAEMPKIQEQFEGFTWYPNTISYAPYTFYGSAAMYGGYEYTPIGLNKRTNQLMKSKLIESYMVMPVMFDKEGYDVSLVDLPEEYDITTDELFRDYPGIGVHHLSGRYTDDTYTSYQLRQRNRNFFCYSMMRIAPEITHKFLYSGGTYLSQNSLQTIIQSQFLTSYYALQHLAEYSDIRSYSEGGFCILHNYTTHEPSTLQMPDYMIQMPPDNRDYNTTERIDADGNVLDLTNPLPYFPSTTKFQHYCVNMASFIQLGEWFDFLRREGVYDNTRIIIVADHGASLGLLEAFKGGTDVAGYNPLLMVKDFDKKGVCEADWKFMTNADTPLLATQGVLNRVENPFTDKPLTDDHKHGSQYLLPYVGELCYELDEKYQIDMKDVPYYVMHDDLFDVKNWEVVFE